MNQMRDIHQDLLWIGNAVDIRTPEKLFDVGISAVVDVAYEELPAQLPRGLIYCRFPINDGGGNDPAVLRQAVQTIYDLIAAGTRTIVACSVGMSRSPAIAVAALSVYLAEAPVDIILRLRESAPLDVSGQLWSDVVGILPGVRSMR
jgi:protein-tyrosine phosphatase